MPMDSLLATTLNPLSPVAWLGRQVLAVVGYAGGLTVLVAGAGAGVVRRGSDPVSLTRRVAGELDATFRLGLPVVALVFAGLGMFLAMQGYYGGTFVEGTGAVVGVGLFRNVAPLLSGQILACLLAARLVPELRNRAEPETPRGLAARLVAATVAGPVFGAFGTLAGTVVGWEVAQTMMGVSTHDFFSMFWDMLWARDVLGVLVKGLAFGLASGALACHEGTRRAPDGGPGDVPAAAGRAAALALLATLVVNSAWFLLVYHAGPAGGPTLIPPPSS